MQNTEFIVIKKSYSFSTCHACNGSGVLEKKFRDMVFLHDCEKCNGDGRIRHSISEEYPLSDAIREMSLEVKG